MKIKHTLNKAQADALFLENAVAIGGRDVVFDYKAAEIFGDDVCAWAESCMKFEGYINSGKDYGVWGSGSNYFCKSGFDKLVSQHNHLICLSEYKASDGGKIWDELWAARRAHLAALDAEEDRKREERKAKRAASRKAKQEAAEQAAST
ncbi:MAG: hypothetical protein IKA47_08290 [Oscillospiraceae bacterium]|nr:hypothetical protein [Oscillospiraceae bacterium]